MEIFTLKLSYCLIIIIFALFLRNDINKSIARVISDFSYKQDMAWTFPNHTDDLLERAKKQRDIIADTQERNMKKVSILTKVKSFLTFLVVYKVLITFAIFTNTLNDYMFFILFVAEIILCIIVYLVTKVLKISK